MSDKLNEIAKGSFLRVNEEGKAYWGQSEGGSVSSWNDLTDKPMVETEEVLFAEATVTIPREGHLLGYYSLVDGQAYVVRWDGVEYSLTAQTMTDEYGTYIFVGNPILLGLGEDNGLPFIIASSNGQIAVMAATAGDYTISITTKTAIFNPDLIPNVPLIVNTEYKTISGVSGTGPFADTNVATMIAAFHSKRPVFLSLKGGSKFEGIESGQVAYLHMIGCTTFKDAQRPVFAGIYCDLPNRKIFHLAVLADDLVSSGGKYYATQFISLAGQSLLSATTTSRGSVMQATAVADVTNAPTAEEFNALLAALRTAGIMAKD